MSSVLHAVRASSVASPARPLVPSANPATRVGAGATLAVDDVSVRFGSVTALENVSFDVPAGGILCLLGPSGSGKSTMLRVLAGIDAPTAGRVFIEDQLVAGETVFVEPERRHVGMVFQDYALFPHLSIRANVAFGLRGRSRTDVAGIVDPLLARLDVARYADSYPHMLSGGERQRVALARALAPAPRVLLLDEPFSGLDDRLRDRVRQETTALLRETGTTAVVVTHDPVEAMRVGDRLAVLRGGRLLQIGATEAVFDRPASGFVARFLSEVNLLRATCRDGDVETALGRIPAPGCASGAALLVCIRPEHLHASATAGPDGVRGTVILREFLGGSERIVVDVPGIAEPLVVRTSERLALEPGAVAFLRLERSAVALLPDDDSPNSDSFSNR